MAVGDEIGLTEDLYMTMIGRYVATIEVLSKRLVAKDQHIARLETTNAQLEAENLKHTQLESKYEPGEVYFVESLDELPVEAPKKKK